MYTGLTLGKYAPFHKGHQYVIETALKEMQHLIVIIYDSPKVTDIPLNVRANWIRYLYPNVEVIEAYNGPEEVGYSKTIMRSQETYVINLLNGKQVSHFYSSERYGEHMSKALNAKDRRIDERRIRFPVSATQIRENLTDNINYLDPHVLNSLITGA